MTLNTPVFRAASLLASACVALVTVHGQTTYSSPVKVTNTPLPVSGTVAVTGRVSVDNTVPVTVPAGVPLPVKIGDVLSVAPANGSMPVAQQGTVTVTPAGGTMPVSGTVALSGTPLVTLSGANNLVQAKPAGTPFTLGNEVSRSSTAVTEQHYLFSAPSGGDSEIEFLAVRCGSASPDFNIELVASGHNFPIFLDLVKSTPSFSYWHGTRLVKIYVSAGSQIQLEMKAMGATGGTTCLVTATGRTY